MLKNHFQTEIQAPPDRVWEIMTDHELYSNWSKASKVTYQKTGSPEKQGKGAIRVFHTGIIKVREEVIDWDPPKSMTYRLLSNWPVKDYVSKMELSAKEGSPEGISAVTLLDWTSSWKSRLPLWAGGGLVSKTLKSALVKFAEGIKSIAETTPHTFLNPEDAPPAVANYSQGILSSSADKHLTTSGIVPTRKDGSVPKDLTEQAEAVWETITKLLEEADMQIKDIVSMTTYVVETEVKNLPTVMEVRDRIMAGHLPASTLVVVPRLANKSWKLEISITASC